MIDTHSHIFDEAFVADRATAILRAHDSGVCRMIMPAIDAQSYDAMFSVARDYPNVCYPTMGLHPTSINDNEHWREDLRFVELMLRNPIAPLVAVGEVGLDFHWSRDFMAQQTEAFIAQVEWSIEYDLPLILHVRKAWDEVLLILKRYPLARGVFHSFGGAAHHLRQALAMDSFYIGIGGVVTYKNAGLAELVARMPLEKILLETDAPYLPPVPHRGQRNESAYLPLIAQKIADIKGVTLDDVCQRTTQNATNCFF